MPRPRTFDEADVVARAREAFAETGFAGTSLDTLLEATGLARQSLYNTFGGKKELFMRAFLSDAAEAVEAVESIRRGSDSPIARIRARLVAVAVAHGAAQAPPSLFTKAAVELSARDPEVAATVAAAFESMRVALRRLHRRGPGGRRDRRRRRRRLARRVLLRGDRGHGHPRRGGRAPGDPARHRLHQPGGHPPHRAGP